MADNARQTHVSPGIYSREIDLTYAVKSLGITTLGLVGETLRGPAFQPILIENWRDFQNTFGGTSTEKFIESQYPKYELPYIAKSYLTESNQLQVCRVLGLSGYNAGPAWVVTAEGDNSNGEKMVVAVIRARGYYEKFYKSSSVEGDCTCPSQTYDTLLFKVGEITTNNVNCDKPTSYNLSALKIAPYIPLDSNGDSCGGYNLASGSTSFDVSISNQGRFKLIGITGSHPDKTEPSAETSGYFEYAVSLNPSDNDYILKVLGTNPSNGDAPIYVESLYDVALSQKITKGTINKISDSLVGYQVYYKADYCGLEEVFGFMTNKEELLTRKDIGKRYLADENAEAAKITAHPFNLKTNRPIIPVIKQDTSTTGETKEQYIAVKDSSGDTYTYYQLNSDGSAYEELPLQKGMANANEPVMKYVEIGRIYTVAQYSDANGKRHYYYRYYEIPENELLTASLNQIDRLSAEDDTKYPNKTRLVKNNQDGKYYRLYTSSTGDPKTYVVAAVTCEMNDYKESYRFASTPWIVSNVKGDYNKIELTKLFRFHTISDGDNANNEIKISIQNVKLDDGTFDVVVRDINDTDDYNIVLEKFSKCTMKPGDSNYIAYKIGSFDGVYESKSKYITVEVNDNIVARNSIPAGFLGYPLTRFDGMPIAGAQQDKVVAPHIEYNTTYDEDIKNRKQYFGLSNLVGVDIDMFTYKGNAAYSLEPEYLTQGFHLDSRLNNESYIVSEDSKSPIITVDGVEGYKFDAISTNNRTSILSNNPVIGTEAEMSGSIYENVDLRKFTVYFYGGFDGWDIYRKYRSNTDDFKLNKYEGQYNEYSGEGFAFNQLKDSSSLKLNQPGITSDWYAYLSGIRQFSNPEEVDINVFATPGIDIINNTSLVEEAIEMIEEERADSIYVVTMPDKPFGAADYIDEMYTPEDAVYELEDTDIDSNYTCTYYPWVKYEDTDNNQYIYLPVTKDVVRNMALTDNTAYPWFAPAGVDRGDVNCVRAHFVTKLDDEDTLYEGRINPVKTFASDGVKIWGQKNLQKNESQLNRIAVRRLLLRMRKLIAISCIGLIFDPNDTDNKNKFLSTVTPILDNIRSNRGISDYRIEVNDTVESRDRRELPAKIYFKPYNALEYITLDFILTPEGVSFDAI